MIRHRRSRPATLILTALPIVLVACGGPVESPSSSEPSSTSAPQTQPAAEVSYEPAYPDDVSTEGLDEEDTAQQTHSHGGEAHSHGDGEAHSHGDETHSHGEGSHTHGDSGDLDHHHGEEGGHGP